MGRMDVRSLKVGLLLLALAVVGCGDDGGGSTTAGQAPADAVRTKAKFLADANAVCTRYREEIEADLQPLLGGEEGPKEPAALARVIVYEAIAPSFEKEMSALRALEPPAGSDGGVARVVAAMKRELVRARARPLEFAGGESPFEGSERVAKRYGLGACGGI